jgi:GAF domain-containing protein
VEKDPRYYAAVAQKVSYATRSLICSPMMAGGRSFGSVEIINKKEGAVFSGAELNLLAYIAHQGALYMQSR